MDLIEEKAALRSSMRQARKAITPEARKAAEDALAERLFSLPAIKNARKIGVYQAYGSEISINDLIKAIRLRDSLACICYPAVQENGIMHFYQVNAGECPGFLVNPAAVASDTSPDRQVSVEQLDVLLIPGIAFDEKCGRLGQGGGYYDRILPHLRGDSITIGIAFEEQVVEAVPVGVHDRRVDYVVTPERIITA